MAFEIPSGNFQMLLYFFREIEFFYTHFTEKKSYITYVSIDFFFREKECTFFLKTYSIGR